MAKNPVGYPNIAIGHNAKVSEYVMAAVSAGVSKSAIFEHVRYMPDGPGSLTTFYKYYRQDMAYAKAMTDKKIGDKIVEKALEGSERLLELYARSKMNWSPSTTVVETEYDPMESDSTPIDDILAMLNIKEEDDKR